MVITGYIFPNEQDKILETRSGEGYTSFIVDLVSNKEFQIM